MRLSELLDPTRVLVQTEARALSKSAVLRSVAELFSGLGTPISEVERVLVEREALQSTGLGDGVAIPHGALGSLDRQLAALLLLPSGVEFEAIDGRPVEIVFALVGPKRATGEHLKTLARISRLLRSPEFRARLLSSPTPEQAFELVATEDAARSGAA